MIETEDDKVERRVHCVLNVSQYRIIKAAADKVGLGVSVYMRQAALRAAQE